MWTPRRRTIRGPDDAQRRLDLSARSSRLSRVDGIGEIVQTFR
jgi:hypothetical protein